MCPKVGGPPKMGSLLLISQLQLLKASKPHHKRAHSFDFLWVLIDHRKCLPCILTHTHTRNETCHLILKQKKVEVIKPLPPPHHPNTPKIISSFGLPQGWGAFWGVSTYPPPRCRGLASSQRPGRPWAVLALIRSRPSGRGCRSRARSTPFLGSISPSWPATQKRT